MSTPEQERRKKRFDQFWVVGSDSYKGTKCLNWIGATGHNGYGVFHWGALGKKSTSAHRAAWMLHHEDDAILNSLNGHFCRLEVHHRCRNRNCVNPEHLALSTRTQNVRETWTKI